VSNVILYLKNFVLERDFQIRDSDFFIVKCKSCGEYGLISKGSGITRPSAYQRTAQLSWRDWNLDVKTDQSKYNILGNRGSR
jgi:hypothetical protein